MKSFFARVLVIAVFSIAVGTIAQPAFAQSPAPLPTAPGAGQKVDAGGRTAAAASIPSAPGKSPLEPYLVLWLLPVAGVLTVIWAVVVDRSVRASRGSRPTHAR